MPGDKSISHRAIILGSICEGDVEIKNFLGAQDCLSTIDSLSEMGVSIERTGTDVLVHGAGKYGFKEPQKPLDVGNSGTTMRILPGILAAQDFQTSLVGDESLSKRPMNRIIEPLEMMGAKIESHDGRAPLKILGHKLSGIDYKLPVASAQVKSAVLLAGLYADGQTVVREKYQSRDHTERMLTYLGADMTIDGTSYTINSDSKLSARPIDIPGDISSAAFFIIGALLLAGSDLTIKKLGVNKTRTGLLDVLKEANAQISFDSEKTLNNEEVADLHIKSGLQEPISINAEQVPLLVDEIPIIAVAATQINGTSSISGAEELRVKETDRLRAISEQLTVMGANIKETNDGLIIKGPTKLRGGVLDSKGDHRMAMSLVIAGLIADGKTTIKGAESIDISFPGFADLLDSVISN